MAIFCSADHHWGHENIIKHCNRPFRDADEMDQFMVDAWNEVVTDNDEVYHLGDFSHKRCPVERANAIARQLNGRIRLLVGNHELDSAAPPRNSPLDFDHYLSLIKLDLSLFEEVNPGYHEMYIDGHLVVMSHYAQQTWHDMSKKSLHLHGHCMDTETEILTTNGWRGHKDISVGDFTYSLNHNTRELDLDEVKEVIHATHTGDVYSTNSKSINFRVTDNHTIITLSYGALKIRERTARETFSADSVQMLSAGNLDLEGLQIHPALIKLYILMVTDASTPLPTGLVRYKVFKKYKLDYCRKILKDLKIEYRSLPQGDGSISINFYVPEELKVLQIKGMDKPFMRALSKRQFEIVLEAYENSDGCKNGSGVIVYSSKEEEIDILQELAVTRGYGATKGGRTGHGHSTKESYQLSIYPANKPVRLTKVKSRVLVSRVESEHFWCIKNSNQNFLCRRNGKVHLTGNSHGRLKPRPRRLDVGVDTHNFIPWSWDQIKVKFKLMPGKVSTEPLETAF